MKEESQKYLQLWHKINCMNFLSKSFHSPIRQLMYIESNKMGANCGEVGTSISIANKTILISILYFIGVQINSPRIFWHVYHHFEYVHLSMLDQQSIAIYQRSIFAAGHGSVGAVCSWILSFVCASPSKTNDKIPCKLSFGHCKDGSLFLRQNTSLHFVPSKWSSGCWRHSTSHSTEWIRAILCRDWCVSEQRILKIHLSHVRVDLCKQCHSHISLLLWSNGSGWIVNIHLLSDEVCLLTETSTLLMFGSTCQYKHWFCQLLEDTVCRNKEDRMALMRRVVSSWRWSER